MFGSSLFCHHCLFLSLLSPTNAPQQLVQRARQPLLLVVGGHDDRQRPRWIVPQGGGRDLGWEKGRMDVNACDAAKAAGRPGSEGAAAARKPHTKSGPSIFETPNPTFLFPRTFFSDAGSSSVADAVAHAHSASRVRNQADAARSRVKRAAACGGLGDWGGRGWLRRASLPCGARVD